MGAVPERTSMAHLSLLLALPALVAGTCEVDLDSVSGSYPPLLIQQGEFKLPTTSRVLTFEDDKELELYCHGSEKHQADTYLEREKDSVHEMVQLGNQWNLLHCLVGFVHQYREVGTNPCCKEHLVSLARLLRKHLRIHNHQGQFRHIDTIFVRLGIALGIQRQRCSNPWYHLHLQI